MADNTTLDTGSGGDVVRLVDHAGVKTPASKLDVGGSAGESLLGTVKFVKFTANASADNTLVAAAGAGLKIRVLSLVIHGADSIRFESGAGGTELFPLLDISLLTDPLILPYNIEGWFETAANTLLNLELTTTGSDVKGTLSYREVT